MPVRQDVPDVEHMRPNSRIEHPYGLLRVGVKREHISPPLSSRPVGNTLSNKMFRIRHFNVGSLCHGTGDLSVLRVGTKDRLGVRLARFAKSQALGNEGFW